MLFSCTHRIGGAQNVSGGGWTSGDWSNLKCVRHLSQSFLLIWPRMHHLNLLTFFPPSLLKSCILEIWYLEQTLMRRSSDHFTRCAPWKFTKRRPSRGSLKDPVLERLMGPQFVILIEAKCLNITSQPQASSRRMHLLQLVSYGDFFLCLMMAIQCFPEASTALRISAALVNYIKICFLSSAFFAFRTARTGLVYVFVLMWWVAISFLKMKTADCIMGSTSCIVSHSTSLGVMACQATVTWWRNPRHSQSEEVHPKRSRASIGQRSTWGSSHIQCGHLQRCSPNTTGVCAERMNRRLFFCSNIRFCVRISKIYVH